MMMHDRETLRKDIYKCCNTLESCKECKYDSKINESVLCYLILSAIGVYEDYNGGRNNND